MDNCRTKNCKSMELGKRTPDYWCWYRQSRPDERVKGYKYDTTIHLYTNGIHYSTGKMSNHRYTFVKAVYILFGILDKLYSYNHLVFSICNSIRSYLEVIQDYRIGLINFSSEKIFIRYSRIIENRAEGIIYYLKDIYQHKYQY
jgi:hypothetical protein